MNYTGLATVLTNELRGKRTLDLLGASIPFNYQSYQAGASVNIHGITEFGDVSNPPRKYRQLFNNYGASFRSLGSMSPTYVGVYNSGDQSNTDTTSQRVRYSTAGVRNRDLTISDAMGSASAFPDRLTLEGIEDYTVGTNDWTAFPPTWTRNKKTKSFSDYPNVVGQTVGKYYGWTIIRTGIAGSAVGMRFLPTWNGFGWTLDFQIGGDTGTGGTGLNDAIQVWGRFINGEQNPVVGDVSATDFLVLQSSVSASANTYTIWLPPDTSVRFMLRRAEGSNFSSANRHPAVQVPWQLVDAADPATDRIQWFYFPSTDSLPWKYEETLDVEYRYTDAIILAGGYTLGTEPKARTISLSGGTGAESHTALAFDGRTVLVPKTFTGLLANHRYRVTATNVDNTIGDTDFTTSTDDSDTFRTTTTSYAYTYETKAPVGKERQTTNLVVTDLGAVSTPITTYESETLEWYGRVLKEGATVTTEGLGIADDVHIGLKAAGLFNSIYLIPLLGNNLAAAITPMGRMSVSRFTNQGFVDADYAQATGLQGNGNKNFLTLWTPAALGVNNVSFGHWELDIAGNTGTSMAFGCEHSTSGPFTYGRYGLNLHSTLTGGYYGRGNSVNGLIENANPAQNAFYSVRRSSTATNIRLYRNGVTLGTTASLSDTPHSGVYTMRWMGYASGSFFAAATESYFRGRAGCFFVSNTALDDTQMAALYTVLRDALMIPTGRVSP